MVWFDLITTTYWPVQNPSGRL